MSPPVRTLSIAAPAFDEEEGLHALVTGWLGYLRGRRDLDAFEIVICDDGSRDRTGALLDALAREHPEVRPVHHAQNRGAGAAVATAVQATRSDWVLVTDADGQFVLPAVEALEAAVARTGARAVIGARAHKEDDAVARFGARATTAALNALFGTRYRDLSSAFQLVEGPLLRSLPLEARGLSYSVDIAAQLLARGVAPIEVVVPHRPRQGGRSSRSLVRSSLHRALFVGWIGARRGLTLARVLAERS